MNPAEDVLMHIDDVCGETFETNICLLPMISNFSREILKLFDLYSAGVLPVAGGYYDQPNIILGAFDVVRLRKIYLNRK